MAKYDIDPSFSKYLSVTFLSKILPGNKFHFFDKNKYKNKYKNNGQKDLDTDNL